MSPATSALQPEGPQAYDAYLYRERHLVECINKIKHYRRFESLAAG